MSEEPLREPEPEPGRELERRLRERDRRTPWVRIVILALALIAVLVFHQSISNGIAGCFGEYVVSKGKPDAASPSGEVKLRVEPARRLPLGDAAP